jgi:hypothetical protein
MSDLERLISNYIAYNPRRIYSLDDYVLRYHNSFETLCRYKCIKNKTTKEFKADDWETVECVSTGIFSIRYQKASYLGDCAKNITYSIRKNPERFVPFLPRLEDVFFDNVTFLP